MEKSIPPCPLDVAGEEEEEINKKNLLKTMIPWHVVDDLRGITVHAISIARFSRWNR
jgi:hypothetical protein